MKITWEYQGVTESVDFVKDDIIVGRGPDKEGREPDLCLAKDAKISRHHARIWQEDDDYWLEDLGSSRGTLVNGHPLTSVWGLTEKDVITVGETTLRVSGMREFKTMVLRPPAGVE